MPTAKAFDPGVYVITDSGLSHGRSPGEIIIAAVAGGATCIQLREKGLSTREYYNLAKIIRDVTLAQGVTFIVNDHLDVALAIGADGVHLGADDIPAAAARTIMPPGMILGVTARNLQQALQFQADGANYLGVGSVFPTGTKKNTGPPIGLQGLAEICEKVAIPVVGIGGIDAAKAGAVIKAGANGVAVVSAVVSAKDIAVATREVVSAVYEARSKKGVQASEN